MTETSDYLIVGGGSAGCVIARRLAEKTKARIIMVEAGRSDDLGTPESREVRDDN